MYTKKMQFVLGCVCLVLAGCSQGPSKEQQAEIDALNLKIGELSQQVQELNEELASKNEELSVLRQTPDGMLALAIREASSNPAKALETFRKLIDRFPDSQQATESRKRITAVSSSLVELQADAESRKLSLSDKATYEEAKKVFTGLLDEDINPQTRTKITTELARVNEMLNNWPLVFDRVLTLQRAFSEIQQKSVVLQTPKISISKQYDEPFTDEPTWRSFVIWNDGKPESVYGYARRGTEPERDLFGLLENVEGGITVRSITLKYVSTDSDRVLQIMSFER